MSALALAASGCASTTVSDPSTGVVTTDPLTAAQTLWNAKKPAGDRYVMVQRVVCTCTVGNIAYRITVVGGGITDVVNDRTDVPLATSSWNVFKTVTQLFDIVRVAQTQTGQLKTAEYDPTMGFPRTVSIDPNVAVANDEVSYVTTSVSAAP